MAKLTEAQKLAIVTHLACFRSPSEVAELVKEELGLELPRQQIAFYDPTTVHGKQLSEPLREVFWETRKRFLDRIEDIPTANLAVRIRMLDDVARSPKIRSNARLLGPILEQIAKDVGGAFTNKREVSGPQGQAIPVSLDAAIDKIYGNPAAEGAPAEGDGSGGSDQ